MIGSVKPPLGLKKIALSPAQLSRPNNRLGAQGEQQAVQFLKQKGYRIVETNVRLGHWEVDVVAFDAARREIVFVEVKTRSESRFGHPSQAVNWKKIRAISKLALVYIKQKKLTADFRFDVVSVLPDQIEHFINVTW